jgi:hypothetical protein
MSPFVTTRMKTLATALHVRTDDLLNAAALAVSQPVRPRANGLVKRFPNTYV